MEHKSILLVEDNPDDVELTFRAFRKSNITNHVFAVNDGFEAMDYLFHSGKYSDPVNYPMPALVLLDLKLPKMNGLEVLKEIRKHEATRLLPVVILTSSLEDQDLISSYMNGANSYIRKPVDFNKFMEAVQQLGMYWLLLNESPKTGI
jgi:two-component system, response regulator